jgi:tRNA dimethylallyltransferase
VRIVRAIEVYRATGRPISEHHREPAQGLHGYDSLVLGLDPGRPRLRDAVAERTRRMLAEGLLDETRRLVAAYGPGLRPLRAIGYKQAADALAGRLAPEALADEITKQTLRFAKRQGTWFRKESGISWFAGADDALDAARLWLDRSPTSL